MGVFIVMLVADYQLFLGYGKIDAHMEEIALIVMPVGGFYDYPATYDLFKEFFQLGGFLPDPGLHGSRGLNMTEGDL